MGLDESGVSVDVPAFGDVLLSGKYLNRKNEDGNEGDEIMTGKGRWMRSSFSSDLPQEIKSWRRKSVCVGCADCETCALARARYCVQV